MAIKTGDLKADKAEWRKRRRAHIRKYDYAWGIGRHLQKLTFQTNEVSRLDKHLIMVVNDVANEIARQVDKNTTVKVKGVGILTIVEWTSFVQTRKVLVYGDPRNDLGDMEHELGPDDPEYRCPGAAFGFDVEPNQLFFFDGDISAQGRAASRNNYLSFARHIPDIVNAFAAKQALVVQKLLKAFEMMRHLVGST